jgi:CRISPR-associated protein Cmr6
VSRIAAPDYVASHPLGDAPPGHRFGPYLALWNSSWGIDRKQGAAATALKAALGLGDGAELLDKLRQRQSACAQALPPERCLVVEAVASSPFATGLGNEHPVENGFAFLAPYGLPYLAGSGVKGVLRRAAQELADERAAGFSKEVIDALFGPEDPAAGGDGPSLAESSRRRGALSCWDVFPLPPQGRLDVDVMTPHHGSYYRGETSPNDATEPIPIPFLVLPAGSKLRFVLCFEPALWPPGLEAVDWATLAERALRHAFDWVGFGAKTAIGYGAMQEDEEARAQREQQAAARRAAEAAAAREEKRKKQTPEQAEAEDAAVWIGEFRALLDAEKARKNYKPGGAFDQQRNDLMKRFLRLQGMHVRREAAQVLRDAYKFTGWPSKKERKQEVIAQLSALEGGS